MKVFFFQQSLADLHPNDEFWTKDELVRKFFYDKGPHNGANSKVVTVKNGESLLEVLKTGTNNVLERVNRENRDNRLPEIMMSGRSLTFLSHPGWGNMFYDDIAGLPVSKVFDKTRYVVLRTDNPCKYFYCTLPFFNTPNLLLTKINFTNRF